MFIRKKKILTDKYLSQLSSDSNIYIRVEEVDRFPKEMSRFGFLESDPSGICILPTSSNIYTRKNAEQFYTVDKQKPKEEYTQTVYWTRTEWNGRYDRREVEEFRDFKKLRYHRDYHLPYSVKFQKVQGESSYIVSDSIPNTDANKSKLINTINMVLSIFGECYIDENVEPSKLDKITLNWEVLPKGEYPWIKIKQDIETWCKNKNNTTKNLILRNCKLIYDKNPDFEARGRSGFSGYIIFGFNDKNLYILESVHPNNATYVFDKNWEELSKLTKAEILNNQFHKCRIIHSSSWKEKFDELFGE